jgi:hypothetical protein
MIDSVEACVLLLHLVQYERTHPVYNYELDNCGAMHIVIGDGGNIEGPYRWGVGLGDG